MKLLNATLLAFTMALTTSNAELKVGDDAPEFDLKGSDGKTYKSSDLKDKKAYVIAWFPKVFTGGCTVECESLRERGKEIKNFDVAYFTASTCSDEEAEKFAKSLELDYPILADNTGDVAKAFGVVTADRKVPHRHTFYVGKDGKIAAIDKEISPKSAGEDIAKKLKELKVAPAKK